MYWVPKTATPPLNRQDVLVWCSWQPDKYIITKYYDPGTEMDDGNVASLSGFYTRTKTGKRSLLRSGVSYFLPLETPRPTGETRAKQYRRGYQAALLWVMTILEAMSKRAVGGEAWLIKDLHTKLEQEARRILSARFFAEPANPKDADESEVEVREL